MPILFLIFSACEETDKDDAPAGTGDTGAPPGPTNEYKMARVPLPTACVAPSARRFHGMVWFHANEPVEITQAAGPVERGLLLVGGISAVGGDYLDDVWLFDLTNHRPSACPWVELRSSGALADVSGVAGASLTYDFALQRFLLVGGHRADGAGTISASSSIDILDVESLDEGAFFPQDDIGSLVHSTWEKGASDCETPHAMECRDLGPSCTLLQSTPVDACTGNATGSWNVPSCTDDPEELPPFETAYEGCFEDPLCTGAHPLAVNDEYRVDREVVGLSQYAAAFDPVPLPNDPGGTTWLIGGTTGCTGICTGWAAIGSADHRPNPTPALTLANYEGLVELVGGIPEATISVDPGVWKIPSYQSPADVTVSWPSASTEGVRFASAVFTGRKWDYLTKEWAIAPDAGNTEAIWMIGGTRAQRVGPRATHKVTLHDGPLNQGDPNNCFGANWPSEGQWIENPAAADFFDDLNGDNVVDDSDAGVPVSIAKIIGEEIVGAGVLSSPSSRLFQAAAVAAQDDAFLIVGGITPDKPDGTEQVWLVDAEPTLVDPVAREVTEGESEPRHGAAAVFDPIERKVFVFGGGESSDLYEIWSSADTVEPNLASSFQILEADLEYEFVPHPDAQDPTGEGYLYRGTWRAQVSYRIRHNCQAPPTEAIGSVDTWDIKHCFADRISLHFGDPDVDGDHTLEEKTDTNINIEVVREDGERLLMGPRLVEADGEGLVALQQDDKPEEFGRSADINGAVDSHTFRLPWAVVDEDEFTIVVTWDDADKQDALRGGVPYFGTSGEGNADGALSFHETLTYGAHRIKMGRAACNECYAVVLRGLPIWVGETPDAEVDVAQKVPLDSIHIVGPEGFEGVGIGPDIPCELSNFGGFDDLAIGGVCTSTDGLLFRPTLDLQLFSIQGLSAVPSPDHPNLAVYAQNCLTDEARTSINDHFDSGFALDTAAVEDWFGPTTMPKASVVLTPPAANVSKDVSGTTRTGSFVLTAFEAGGDLNGDPPGWMTATDWRSLMIHEWTHQWIGLRRSGTNDTMWFIEGLAALIETMLYPDSGDNLDRLPRGQSVLIANTVAGSGGWDLITHQDRVEIRYFIAPYTLAQLFHIALATDPGSYSTFDDFLEALADQLFPPGSLYEALDGEQLELAFTDLGVPSFYAEWIAEGRVGTPVVGFTASVDPGTGSVTFTVSQLQQALTNAAGVPFSDFTDVPVYLGCNELGSPSPVAGCQMAEGQAPTAPPLLVRPGDTLSVEVTETSRVAVLSGHALLPGDVGLYAISDGEIPVDRRAGGPSAPTWFTVCPIGSIEPECAVDADADTWAAEGDCDDTAEGIHPGIVDVGPWFDAPVLTDLNCDGIPSPAWDNPSGG